MRHDRALTEPTALSIVYVGQAAAVLATRSGTLVPVTAGPACLVPGGIGVPDRVALAPVLAHWSELAGGTPTAAINLRAWHAAATAVELRIPAVDRAGITAAQIAGLDLLGFEGAHRRLGAAVATRLSCTTRISRHLLAAAAAGRYTEGLIGLAAALASASAPAVRTALAVLGRWGASSGLDQATGFAAAVRAGALVEAGAP